MTKAAEYYAAARQPEKAAEIYKKLLDTATLTDEQTADLWMQYAISIAPGDQEGANRAVDCAKALTPDADTNAEFQFGRVEVYTAKGDGRGAASALRTGKSAYELANAEQKIRFALRLGEISELFGQSRQAEQWYEAALEAPADDLRAHQEAEHGLMRVCMRRDQVEAAEEHGKKALELTEQIAGSRDHTAVPVLADLVLVFMQRGDPEQAKTYSDEAVRLSADSAVPAEQTAAFLAAGRLQAYLGNTADALPLLKCAASLSEEVYGTKSLMYAKAQRRYAEVLFTEEQYAEAAAAFRAAEQSYQQFPGNNGAAEECGYMAANAEKAAGKSKQ